MSSKKSDVLTIDRLLSAMANRHRLEILKAISGREIRVSALCTLTGLTQSALSQHLAKLRALDVVVTRRDGQTIYYSCESIEVSIILRAVAQLERVVLRKPKRINGPLSEETAHFISEANRAEA